jgi:hypothetical protein
MTGVSLDFCCQSNLLCQTCAPAMGKSLRKKAPPVNKVVAHANEQKNVVHRLDLPLVHGHCSPICQTNQGITTTSGSTCHVAMKEARTPLHPGGPQACPAGRGLERCGLAVVDANVLEQRVRMS